MKKSLLLASALAMVLGVGVAVGARQGNNARVEQAEAALSSNVYYFTDNYSFDWTGSAHTKAIYAYAYNTDSDKNAAWPGIQVGYSYNESDERVYVYSADKAYSHIIWHNNDNARAEVDSSTAKGWYVTGWKD